MEYGDIYTIITVTSFASSYGCTHALLREAGDPRGLTRIISVVLRINDATITSSANHTEPKCSSEPRFINFHGRFVERIEQVYVVFSTRSWQGRHVFYC